MLFGRHINKYYLKYLPWLLLGVLSLVLVDYMQLVVPEIYRTVINGLNNGFVVENGVEIPFDMDFLLDRVCKPLLFVILAMIFGRFLWRICFFGAGIRIETALRNRMFDRCRELDQDYYQHNKVGNLMSLFTNDLETVQDCFGMGIMMFFDGVLLGVLDIDSPSFNRFSEEDKANLEESVKIIEEIWK